MTLLAARVRAMGTTTGATTGAPIARHMVDSMLARHDDSAARWHYEHGLLQWAIDQAGIALKQPHYREHAKHVTNLFIAPDGEIHTYERTEYNLDQINHGNLFFALWQESGEPRYRVALDSLRLQMAHQPRNASGGFWHKLIYPYQMWLDGIYMAGPFLARYGAACNAPHLYDEVAFQIKLITQRTRDERTGLLYHAWDESRVQGWSNPQSGVSPHLWGRAVGWYMMALVDILDDLPTDHPERATLIAFLQQQTDAVVRVQDGESGLWWQILDQGGRKGNYLEASASSMFVYALAKGARKGWLAPAFLLAAQRGFTGLVERLTSVDVDGLLSLNDVCAVAGLGGVPYRDGSYEYYVTEPRKPNDYKGVGPFILAALEVEGAWDQK